MNRIKRYLRAFILTGFIAGCSGGGGSGNKGAGEASIDGTYSATLTGIEIVRIADKHPVNVTNLPAQSAVVTVSP